MDGPWQPGKVWQKQRVVVDASLEAWPVLVRQIKAIYDPSHDRGPPWVTRLCRRGRPGLQAGEEANPTVCVLKARRVMVSFVPL